MKVCKYIDVKPSVYEASGVTKYDVITAEDGAPNFCMRVFEVETGCSSAAHSHPWEHEVFVLSGRGAVVGEAGSTEIGKGSVIFIAPNEHHCLVNKGNDPLRFVCLIPVGTEK
jgi:quercetin dioxygenase-like cupin family protein